jgi:hypothetical protein
VSDTPQIHSLLEEIMCQPDTLSSDTDTPNNSVKEILNSTTNIDELEDKLSLLAADAHNKPGIQSVKDMIQNGDSIDAIKTNLSL